MSVTRYGLTAALVVALLTACGGSPRPDPTPSLSLQPTPTLPPTETAATCPASPALTPVGQFEDRRGVGSSAELFALFFVEPQGIQAGKEAKIVWRMTGKGAFTIDATGPEGRKVRPSWGPESHDGSNWSRPGDEWGTGWMFPTPGCWTFSARRAVGTGYLVVRVR